MISRLLPALLFAVPAAFGQSFPNGQFAVKDLGALPLAGTVESAAWGLNNLGQAVGYSGVAAATVSNPVLFTGSSVVPITVIGSLTSATAKSINDSGQIVGWFGPDDNTRVGFLVKDGVTGLAGGITTPNNIANDGVIIGQAFDAAGNRRAAILANGTLTLLGTLNGMASSSALDRNVQGTVVGYAYSGTNERPFIFVNGQMAALPLPAGYASGRATGINEVNQIVGTASNGANTRAFINTLGSTFDIPVPASNSAAYDINSYGMVVGEMSNGPASRSAFLYTGGTLYNLNDLIPAGSGWVLQRATAINEIGQITGVGTLNGQTRAFLLTAPPNRFMRSRYAFGPGETTAEIFIPSFNPLSGAFSVFNNEPWLTAQNTLGGRIRLLALPNFGSAARTASVFTSPNNGTYTITQGTALTIFADVPSPSPFNPPANNYPYAPAINLAFALGITNGCAIIPLRYCPDAPLTREQAAVFIIRAVLGNNFEYPRTPYFGDLPESNPAFKYVQKLRELGWTSGCGGGNYCGAVPIGRADFAVFLVRALANGDNFTARESPYFRDVPPSHPAFKYVQKLRELGITNGCTADGLTYCADAATIRTHAAVLVIRALFGGYGI